MRCRSWCDSSCLPYIILRGSVPGDPCSVPPIGRGVRKRCAVSVGELLNKILKYEYDLTTDNHFPSWLLSWNVSPWIFWVKAQFLNHAYVTPVLQAVRSDLSYMQHNSANCTSLCILQKINRATLAFSMHVYIFAHLQKHSVTQTRA